MNRLFYIFATCAIIQSGCSLFSLNATHHEYITEKQSKDLILPDETKVEFSNTYKISDINPDTTTFYPLAPPRPDSQLQFISKAGVEYTWNRQGHKSWIEINEAILDVTAEIKEFLAKNNIGVDKANTNLGTLITMPQKFHYAKKTKGLLTALSKKGLKLRVKDDENYEGRYIIVFTAIGDNPSKTKLTISYQARELKSTNKQFIMHEDINEQMTNELLKILWVYFSNRT